VFNVGGGELLVVLLLALVFLGPDRLPDAAKKLGRLMGEVRRMTSGFQEEVRSAMDLNATGDAVKRAEPGPQLLGSPPETSLTETSLTETSLTETSLPEGSIPNGDDFTASDAQAEAPARREASPKDLGRGDTSAA